MCSMRKYSLSIKGGVLWYSGCRHSGHASTAESAVDGEDEDDDDEDEGASWACVCDEGCRVWFGEEVGDSVAADSEPKELECGTRGQTGAELAMRVVVVAVAVAVVDTPLPPPPPSTLPALPCPAPSMERGRDEYKTVTCGANEGRTL